MYNKKTQSLCQPSQDRLLRHLGHIHLWIMKRSGMVMAFVNQAAPGIRHKIQKVDRLAEKSIQKLLTRKYTTTEKLWKINKWGVMALENTKYTWNMAWTPLVFTAGDTDERKHQLRCLARGQGKVLHCGMPQAAERPKCLLQGKGYWVKECPPESTNKRTMTQTWLPLCAGFQIRQYQWQWEMGFRPSPQSRITIRVEGKLTNIFVDTGVHHLVLTKAYVNLSQKKSWVQGATGKHQCSWTTQITLEFKMSHKFHFCL